VTNSTVLDDYNTFIPSLIISVALEAAVVVGSNVVTINIEIKNNE